MNWFSSVDLYCERASSVFWAEPLNALSNASFILAAVWALHTAAKKSKLDAAILLLSLLAVCIGIGSFLFHTYATVWASFADVIPIWTFVALYVVLSVIKLTGRAVENKTVVGLCLITVTVLLLWIVGSGSASQTQVSASEFNDSEQYLPAWIGLLYFSLSTWLKRRAFYAWVTAAALTFSVSLLARTVDLYLCETLTVGTHFIWHLCNGAMVAFLLQAFIRMESSSRD